MSVDVQKRWSTDQLITGIETADWLKLLSKNSWKVDPVYYHRAAWISAFSMATTAAARFEDIRYGRELASMEINPAPLFLLGHWRSGTTHLHNLFGRMPGHTYPTVYQVVFPTCFLSTANIVQPITSRLMTDTRTYDNVKHGWNEAAEDEIALAKLTGMSPYLGFMFPGYAHRYEKFLDFEECSETEKKKWKDAFRYFIKKIMLSTGGDRVVVKSCTHTARIRLILDMFPDARFVHITRNPYEVFASTMHMRSHTDWENHFHVPEGDPEEARARQTLALGQRMFERVVDDRRLIPEGNLVEIKYEDLVGNEMAVMERLYATLRLSGWEAGRAGLAEYTNGLKGYKRNQLRLEKGRMADVYDQWRILFDTYGYDRNYKMA